MADNDGIASPVSSPATSSLSYSSPPPPPPTTSRPTLTLPPRSSMESLFTGGAGASPGPMTLVSSFFSDNDPDCEYRSFSQLLAGAMASPDAAAQRPSLPLASDAAEEQQGGAERDSRFTQNPPSGLSVIRPPNFTVLRCSSPSGLLDSPAFYSGTETPFRMSHQQALAQVTAQAAQESALVATIDPYLTPYQQISSLASESASLVEEPLEISQSDKKSHPISFTADKPAADGYNWRKYGQKQVKGSEYPRSYYKCTLLNCPVRKKVEHSADGQVTEIIYKGQHDHPPPNRRSKDTANLNENSHSQPKSISVSKVQTGNINKLKQEIYDPLASKMDDESRQATPEHASGSSGSEDATGRETRVEGRGEDEPDSKRRKVEDGVSEPATSLRTITEPKIIVQTTSEVDLLDDGYRWRKYGQKVVKGNPYPRSYYKCTSPGCNVRKHVERAAADPKAVITTYEGKHGHDIPMGRSNSRPTANSTGLQLKPNAMAAEGHAMGADQCPRAVLQLKEEQAA